MKNEAVVSHRVSMDEWYRAVGLEKRAARILNQLQTQGPSSEEDLTGPGMSRWSVSMSLRRLSALGLVHATRVPHEQGPGRPWFMWTAVPVDRAKETLRREHRARDREIHHIIGLP